MAYSIEERGSAFTQDYTVFFKGPGGYVSPLHDIPLHPGNDENVFNMVVEVPRWTNAKMEISMGRKLNPIKQDIKKGKVRFVNNCFPHHGYIWNYGAIPQTWEDPNHEDPHTGCKGDNDPIDVCEIGYKVHNRGAVIQVKVLGIMALIDEGETDWKVLAIDVTDPLAADLNDVDDIEKYMPGFIAATHEWFRIYKIPTGKPENEFAFNGEAKDKAFTTEIIKTTHEQWKSLINKTAEVGEISTYNTTVEGSPDHINQEQAQEEVNASPAFAEPAAIDAEVDKWCYVKL